MKKSFTKIISALLVLTMIMSVMSFLTLNVSAAPYSGTCGDNLAWAFDDSTGELVITGMGDMYDDYYCGDNRPWEIYADKIKTVTISDSVTSIGNYAFSSCANLTSVTIGDNVTTIGNGAFEFCGSLTSIVIPEAVTSIGGWAFYHCTGLTNLTIPDSVITIQKSAFRSCSNLRSLIIPNAVKVIDDYAFFQCDSLTSVYYEGLEEEWNEVEIGDYNELLLDATIYYNCIYGSYGENLTWAFNTDTGELSINGIGEMCNNYHYNDGPWASYKDEIKTVVINDGITTIGDYAFYYFTRLTNIQIPDGVESIGYCSFVMCTSLIDITIPASVKSINVGTFSGCYSLDKIIVHEKNNVYSSDEDGVMFNKDKTKLIQYPLGNQRKDYTIPNDVIIIGEWAFYSCETIENVTIPSSVKYIESYAFRRCRALESVIIFDGVTDIGYCAFYDSPNITDVYYTGSEKDWSNILIDEFNYFLVGATIRYNYCPHSYESVVTAPTCTEQGYTTYTCKCGDTYIADYVDATGHNYTSKITTPATHTATGIMTYACSCGDTYTETIAKSEKHSHSAVVTAPTCEDQGYTTYTCECGDTYVADYVDATGHTAGEWVVTIPATTTTHGVKIQYCVSCKTVLATQVIPATGKVSGVAISDILLDYKSSTTITPSIVVDSGVKYTVTYSSSNPSVASVDENGKVTSNGTGSATITVTVTDEFGNTVSDTCEVKVNYNWWQWIIVIVLFGWIWY